MIQRDPIETYELSGNCYVSMEMGNDSSWPIYNNQARDAATLLQQTMQCIDKTLDNFVPKASIQAASNIMRSESETCVVKGLEYREGFNMTQGTLIAEGLVNLRGNGNVLSLDSRPNLRGFRISGYTRVQFNYFGVLQNCMLVDQPCSGSFSNVANTVFAGCPIACNGSGYFQECVFFNCAMTGVYYTTGCDFGSGTTVFFVNGGQQGAIRNNNVRGLTAVDAPGVNGISQNQLLEFAAHREQYPEFNVGSFSADPQFNARERYDFTLRPNSPNIGRAVGGGNIGGQRISRSLYATDMFGNRLDATGLPDALLEINGAIWYNIVRQGNDLIVGPLDSYGTILTAPIFNSASSTALGMLVYFGLLMADLNSTTTAGYRNVPRCGPSRTDNTLVPYHAMLWRWTTNQAMPGVEVDADYNNGGMMAPGDFTAMAFNKVPRIDAAGRGNAVPGFVFEGSSEVGNVWCQGLLRLTNDKY